ncbi:MAG: cell division protein FtsA [Clostridia bacterium]
MARKEVIAGLDIGTSAIKVVIGEIDYQNDQMNIIGYAQMPSKGLSKSDIIDIDSVAECIVEAADYAERMAGVEIEGFYVALPTQHVTIIHNSGAVAISGDDRIVKEEDVDRVLNAARVVAIPPEKRIIDIIPSQFRIDNKSGVQRPVGMAGVRLEVDAMLIALDRAVEQNIVSCVEHAGFDVFHFILNPLAASHEILTVDEKEIGAILIDFGAGTTEISYFKKGYLKKVASVPLGGIEVTSDLASVLRIPQRKAEELKKAYGSLLRENEEELTIKDTEIDTTGPIEYKLLNDVIEARLGEILNLIVDELIIMDFKEPPPAGIKVIGGVTQLPGFNKMAEKYLQATVELGYSDSDEQSYITSKGLVHYAFDNNLTLGYFEGSERKSKGGLSKLINWFKDLFEME